MDFVPVVAVVAVLMSSAYQVALAALGAYLALRFYNRERTVSN
jgi:hypothetical protein